MSNGDADALSRISWDRVITEETVKSPIVNLVTQSNAVVEAYVGSVVTINKSAPVVKTPNNSKKKWVEEQTNDSNIGEMKQFGSWRS